jgi:hypothetical protein
MAGGGFKFLLLTFQYLVGLGIFNLLISMNSFRLVHIESYQRCSPAVQDPRGAWSATGLSARPLDCPNVVKHLHDQR